MDENVSLVISTAWAVLSVVGRWLLFRKAGRPGWFSLIPILNVFQEYSICWRGGKVILLALLTGVAGGCAAAGQDNPILMGVAGVALLWVLVIHWRESMKLARSFGLGGFSGFLLFLFDKVGRVILGLSSAEYVGKP